MDVTDALEKQIDPVIDEFETVAGGFFTSQKLKYFNELADKTEPEVKALDPSGVNLTPLSLSIDALESEAKNFERKLRYTNETVNDQLSAGSKLLNESRFVLLGTRKSLENIQNTIYEVQKLADSIDSTESTKAENAISDANYILDQLREHEIDLTPTETQLENASKHLDEIESFIEPVKQQNIKLDNLRSAISNFSNKLDDLTDHANEAIKLSKEAEYLHWKNKNAPVNAKFETVGNHTKETQNNIDGTARLGKEDDITLGEIYRFMATLDNVNNHLDAINSEVDKKLPSKKQEYDALGDIITQSDGRRAELVELVSS